MQGVNGRYNFYVIAFDANNNFADYGDGFYDLSLNQAWERFEKAVKSYPDNIVIILGVAYFTEKTELDINGSGTVDLLQCITGKTGKEIIISDSYKQSDVLKTEGKIAIDTMEILKRNVGKLQENSNTVQNEKTLIRNSPVANKSELQQNQQKKSLLQRLDEKKAEILSRK